MTGRGSHQILDRKLPIRPSVISLWKLCDVVAGIAEGDQLAPAEQLGLPPLLTDGTCLFRSQQRFALMPKAHKTCGQNDTTSSEICRSEGVHS